MVAEVEQAEAERLRLEKRLALEVAPTEHGIAFAIELPAPNSALGDDLCVSCLDGPHDIPRPDASGGSAAGTLCARRVCSVGFPKEARL